MLTYAVELVAGGNAGKMLHIPKLEDANWAGTSKAHDCTLILTGDLKSALIESCTFIEPKSSLNSALIEPEYCLSTLIEP